MYLLNIEQDLHSLMDSNNRLDTLNKNFYLVSYKSLPGKRQVHLFLQYKNFLLHKENIHFIPLHCKTLMDILLLLETVLGNSSLVDMSHIQLIHMD